MAQLPPLHYLPQQTSSPSPSGFSATAPFPPNKRQRLSPTSFSPPHDSPAFQSMSLPGTPPQLNGNINMSRPPVSGSMGPPSKPAEERIENLTDAISGSGINLADEENFLTSSFTSENASFQSNHSGGPYSGNFSANNSFETVTRPPYPPQNSFYLGGGNLSGPPLSYESAEDAFKREWNARVRELASVREAHLNEPFANTILIRRMLHDKAVSTHLSTPYDSQRFFDPRNEPLPGAVRASAMTGADGTSIRATYTSTAATEATMADVLALISLATQERLREVLEEAVRLARGRRVGSDGVVPTEWQDLAVPQGSLPTFESSRSNGRATRDKTLSPKPNQIKRSGSARDSRSPTPPSGVPSVKFPNELVKALRTAQAKDREYEEARLLKRRRRAEAAAGISHTPDVIFGEVAPEAEIRKRTKREQAKAQEARKSEVLQRNFANETASHMLQGGGGAFGKKKYAWMTSGQPTPSPVGGSLGGNVRNTPGDSHSLTPPIGKRAGEFRENSARGEGIQLRDLIAVLEEDGRARKVLLTAYYRLQ